jgi:WD40 repeat protein
VNAVAVGQLGGRTVVVSGSDDGTVRVWDAAVGEPLGGPFTGHTGYVNAVAVGQLGGRTVVVSGSDDGTVRVWDAAVGEPLGGPLTGHTDWINAVTIAQLGGRTVVVSGSRDRTVRIWTTYDLLGRYGRAEVLPGKIDLAASVLGIAFAAPSRLMVATELGVVSLRMQ